MPWPSVCRWRAAWPCRIGSVAASAATPVSLALRLIPQRCRCCKRHRRKEKGAEDEDTDLDIELANQSWGKSSSSTATGFVLGNGQDADERGALGPASAAEVPAWQMPKLVVECSRRPGARVHKGTSLILPEAGGDLIAGIVANLPVLLQIRPCWQLGYSMAVDGVSLRTMYRQVSEVGPCVLIVEDSNNCIFGAFLSEGLRPVNQCYGSHECFVFRYPRDVGGWLTEIYCQEPPRPEIRRSVVTDDDDSAVGDASVASEQYEALKKCQAFQQVASPSAAVFCDHTGIVIGIDGPGLFIDQDLLRGVSWPSKAMRSPCLAGAGPDFVVRNLEVWHWAPS